MIFQNICINSDAVFNSNKSLPNPEYRGRKNEYPLLLLAFNNNYNYENYRPSVYIKKVFYMETDYKVMATLYQ